VNVDKKGTSLGGGRCFKLFATIRRYFIDSAHIWPLAWRKSMTGRNKLETRCTALFSFR
jgi:hypothetical protein